MVVFNTCPFPTTWSKNDAGKYNADNGYGNWVLGASSYYGAGYEWYQAFDNDTSTYWWSGGSQIDSTYEYIDIYMPKGVSIKPTSFKLVYSYIGTTSKIQGYTDADGWVDLCNIGSKTNQKTTSTANVTTDKFFTAFRYTSLRYSNTQAGQKRQVYEFQCTAGTLKIE